MAEPWLDHPSWAIVDAVSEATGRDVADLVLHAEAPTLTQTRNAQLATFTTSLVALDALRRAGVQPDLVAGHSLGEYTALVAAGILSLADGARLVAARGEAMQAASDQRSGTMAAVLGAPADAVEEICVRSGRDVWLANDNAPGQAVIAGDPDAVERAGADAKQHGARRVMALAVGGAFHTPFMAPAEPQLREALAEATWDAGRCPVVANVDAALYRPGTYGPELLRAQLTRPVRWRPSLEGLAVAGTRLLVEVGPGTVLTGLAKRTVPDIARTSVDRPQDALAVATTAVTAQASTGSPP